MTAEELAENFYTTQNALAPTYFPDMSPTGFVPWKSVHEQHQNLMIAVCREMLQLLQAERDTEAWEQDMADMAQITKEWRQYRTQNDDSPPSKAFDS